MKGLLFILFSLVLCLGCSSSEPVLTAVTLAIPLNPRPDLSRVIDYERILRQDSLLLNGRLEGLPEKQIEMTLDPAKMKALDLRALDVMKSIQRTYPAGISWTVSADSLLLSFPATVMQTNASMDDFARTPIQARTNVKYVQLWDFAMVAETEKSKGVLIKGRNCLVIRGMTKVSEKEFQAQLLGAERYLGNGWFLVWGE